ncbi:MAG: 6-carboxytetrahydropterin synthase [Bacteroidetes bacterium]|jgi:6-pyruvoyltetrahydropterin/6-carboxytetrahydropterin synthase|nr:6-carboxytetrahydropterin synthase [Bacteroidota bacterium]
MRTTVCRKEHFNAAHRIFNPAWDQARNLAVFGKCAYENYHGHNYELVVKLTGDINPETGYLIDLKTVARIVEEEVVLPFDHKNLNLDCPEFAQRIPSCENIAQVIWLKLRQRFENEMELEVILYETPRNWVEYRGL